MTRRPLIVVSNRGPVSFARDDEGARVVRRGAGGLATALRGLLVHQDVTWIASAISEEDRVVATEASGLVAERAGAPCRLRLLSLDPESYEGFYNAVANPLLWFVQHSLYGLGDQPVLDERFELGWRGYVEVNKAFAEAVVAALDNDPGAAVFFHDYHLYLAPRFVREARPDALLAHFVHIPWPQSDGWTVLPEPERRAIHDGLLANDLVGFHTRRWRRNFVASVEDVLAAACDREGHVVHRGRTTTVTSRPISVDCDEFDMLAVSPDVLEADARIGRERRERLVPGFVVARHSLCGSTRG